VDRTTVQPVLNAQSNEPSNDQPKESSDDDDEINVLVNNSTDAVDGKIRGNLNSQPEEDNNEVDESSTKLAKKLSKSESFSHKSEFDDLGKKRKGFAQSKTMIGVSRSSSSEEDLPSLSYNDEGEVKLRSSGGSQDKGKTMSMMNVRKHDEEQSDAAKLEAKFEQWKADFIKQQQLSQDSKDEENEVTAGQVMTST